MKLHSITYLNLLKIGETPANKYRNQDQKLPEDHDNNFKFSQRDQKLTQK